MKKFFDKVMHFLFIAAIFMAVVLLFTAPIIQKTAYYITLSIILGTIVAYFAYLFEGGARDE